MSGVLLTDLEGSTRHMRALGENYASSLGRHLEILRTSIAAEGGVEIGSEGDSISAVFASTEHALRAAVAAQRSLGAEPWPDQPWHVRMGVHAGPVTIGPAGAVGAVLHEAARIRNAAHGGQILVSDASKTAIEDLPDDLELHDLGFHEIRDIEGPVRVWQVVAPDLRRDFPPLRAVVTRAVPRGPTSFVGRVAELAEIAAALDGSRLVTLVGSGGSGKTRLAFEHAARSGAFDSVYVVELAEVVHGDVVTAVVASVVGSEEPSLPSIVAALTSGRALLLLDNCEHLLDACSALVADLLRGVPRLHILATGRSPLGNAGERVILTPPLDTSDACALFIARAAATIGAERAAALDSRLVVSLCETLQQMPLAIELAAARLRSLSLTELVTRLHDQLNVLTSGPRDAPRHQTMRAMIDWSYALLSEDEQSLLRGLSVFVGGFPVDGAESIGVAVRTADVPGVLDGLVLKSLVSFDVTTDRYGILEPVRQYGRERLDGSGESQRTQAAHAEWIAKVAERSAREWFQDERTWRQRLDEERGNIGAAIGWALDNDQDDVALRIVGGLCFHWFFSRRQDAQVWIPLAMERIDRVSPRVRARALLGAGIGMCDLVADERPIEWLTGAVSAYRDLKSDAGLGTGLFWLGRGLAIRERNDAAYSYFLEGRDVNMRLGNIVGLGWCMSWLSSYHRDRREFDRAEAIQREVLELGETHSVLNIVGAAHGELGLIATARGDDRAAFDHFDQAVRIFRELHEPWLIAGNITRRAHNLLGRDDSAAAADVAEALFHWETIGADTTRDLGFSLALAADLLLRAGRVTWCAEVAAVALPLLGPADPDAPLATFADLKARLTPVSEASARASEDERSRGSARAMCVQARAWLIDAYDLS